jgi:hypothetical protein
LGVGVSRLLGWVASRAGAPSVLAMAAATAGFASSGCTSSGDAPPTLGTTVNGIDSGGSTNSCATPNTDCPCTDEGQTVACGEVVMRSGDYVSCSEGTRTCVNGAWSVCAGSYVTTQSLTLSTNGIRVQKLNPSLPCGDAGVGNLCDPLCTTFIDDPSGLDAGLDSGLTINEAGITLTGNPIPPAQCKGLAITPNTSPTKDLVITSISSSGTPSPSNVQFSASLTPAGCYPGTPTYLWDIDKYDTAQISSTGLLNIVAPIAGPVTVTGFAGSLTASVVSNVTVNVVDATGAPAGVTNAQFPATTGTADSIKVLYPYPATVFPLGLPSPLIQWSNGGTAATAVKVTLRFPTTGTTLFSWSEIVPESQTAPTPSLPAQPRATIPQAIWNAFQQTVVRNSGSTGGDAIFAIQRYVKGATSTTLYAEVPTTFHFANGQLKGNIFYNSYGTNLVKNFASTAKGAAFGAATLEVAANGTAPTVVVGYNDSTNSGAGCRVCHNVAANGSVILSNSYLSNGSTGSGATEATTFTYNPNLSTPALIQSSESLVGSYGSNVFTFAGLSPDGTYLMTSAAPQAAGGAGIYDAKGNLISSNMPSGLRVATPAFADDATHVAFNYYSGNASPLNTLSSADGRSLAMMDFAAPKTFSNFRVLYTPPTGVAYSVWPSFLPPGENGVVFQNEVTTNTRDFAGTRSTCDGSGTCNNIGATAELWWVSTGTTPVANKLTNLNGGSYLPRSASTNHGAVTDSATYYEEVYNYEPAVLPVTIGGYSWVAFTSRRLYGNVATINPYWSDPRYQDISVQPTTKKIWIAAISQNPTAGTDPSFPAFYLPGQELLSGNARAYFSLAACESASTVLSSANLCTSNLDCCGATTTPATSVCQLDPPPLANPPTSHCVPLASLACSADGASCSGDAQCCNYGMGSHCASGVCAPSPPLLTYSPAPFVVNFTAACQLDGGVNATYPAWRFFYWQSNTPNGTSITFTAQTSQDGVTYGAPVAIGTAQPPPNVTSTWTAASTTVDQALKASGQTSQTYLRVTATLNPDSTKTITPALTSWQLQYDCEPSE